MRSSRERFDGSGHPDGLAGDDIPLGARIVAVCDAFDAMLSHRPWRPAMGTEQALVELHAGAGSQFDAAVVDAFDAVIDERSQLRLISGARAPFLDDAPLHIGERRASPRSSAATAWATVNPVPVSTEPISGGTSEPQTPVSQPSEVWVEGSVVAGQLVVQRAVAHQAVGDRDEQALEDRLPARDRACRARRLVAVEQSGVGADRRSGRRGRGPSRARRAPPGCCASASPSRRCPRCARRRDRRRRRSSPASPPWCRRACRCSAGRCGA